MGIKNIIVHRWYYARGNPGQRGNGCYGDSTFEKEEKKNNIKTLKQLKLGLSSLFCPILNM